MPWNPNGPVSNVQSPTQLVMAYLASKGLPPTAQNVSRALQMASTNPGVIPGLSTQAPPVPDAPASTSKQSSGAGGMPVPPQPPQQAMPTPPIPPQQDQQQPTQPQVQPQPQAPSSDGGGGSNWLTGILQSLLGGGAAVGLGAMRPGSPGIQSSMGNQPMPPTGRMMDVPGVAIGGPGQQLGLQGPQGQQALPAPPMQLGGPQASMPQGQPQVGGPGNAPRLAAPSERPAIPMPNQSSGPTINLPTSGLSGMGEPLPGRPVMPEMGSGINWSKVLGEIAPLLKGAVR